MNAGHPQTSASGDQIRVLAVDDSVVIRQAVAAAVNATPGMEMIGTAANGRIALEKIARLRPDVVVLDLEMPVMDGYETLAEIRRNYPTFPVVIFSHVRIEMASRQIDLLLHGPTEFVSKPSATDSSALGRDYLRNELVHVIQTVSSGRRTLAVDHDKPTVPSRGARGKVTAIAIATSTGGPNALSALLSGIPLLPVPILIVQHMPSAFIKILAQRLDLVTPARVREAVHDQIVEPNEVYIAPGGAHMEVVRSGRGVAINVHDGPKENFCRPSADVLFRSVATVYGSGAIGVVLTGMGSDGRLGSAEIVRAGGRLLVQTPESAVVATMPAAVAPFANAVLSIDRIAQELAARVKSGGRL